MRTDDFYHLLHDALSRRLKIPYINVNIIVESSIHGRLHQRCAHRSRTWNRNFWNFILATQTAVATIATNFGAGYISIKRPNAAMTAYGAGTLVGTCIGLVNDSNYGILAGRGTDAEAFDGFTLTTPITHGSGANQLSHRAQAASAQAYTAGTKTWDITLTRLFDNTSGNTITVTEAGLFYYYPGYGHSWMNSRDLLATPVDVLNNGVLSISYPLQVVFPN